LESGHFPGGAGASLIDPAKLATLAARGANPRVQKYTAQLHEARLAGQDAAQVAVDALHTRFVVA
jgi:hypothetical protein